MKTLMLFSVLLTSSFALAGEKYICREILDNNSSSDLEYGSRKMILNQVSDDVVKEGKFYPFKLEIYEFNSGKALFTESVNVRVEDVMFRFTNTAKKVSGLIYLDEADQTWLRIGSTKINFDCN